MVSALTRKLLRDIVDLKGQVISIGLVVSMGVAVLIGSLSTYTSLQYSQEYFYNNYHFADVFANLKRAPNQLITQIAQIPGVQAVNTRIAKEVNLDLPDMDEPAVGQFISLPKDNITTLNAVHIRQGRTLEPHRNDEILISDAFAKEHHLKPGNKLSAIVNSRRQEFTIVGIAISPEYIYIIRRGSLIPDNKHFGVMWLNQEALANAFNMEGAFNNVTLKLNSAKDQPQVINALERLLRPFGGLGVYGRNEQISHQFLSNEFRQLEFMATVIPSIFIGIACFLLNMVTTRLVALQRQHIAILKSLGYSNWSVGLFYLKLVALIVIMGTLGGIAFGGWMGNGMIAMYRQYFVFPSLEYQMNPYMPILGFLVSMASASIGAIGAVKWVVDLPPSVAMRPPVPLSFHDTIIERYKLLHWFSASNKMIARNILRRPFRNLLSSIGIATGVGIVVMGLFWSDAINYIINAQFNLAERGQILISFVEPVKKTALRELQEQPGVLSVEGFRVAPVRLRAGHRTYLTGLYGYEKDSKQKLLLDPRLKPIQITPGQLLISKSLSIILKVQPGDNIQLEVLEGKRQIIETKLSGIVDDFIGFAAYADSELVDQLLDEHELMSVANMRYDSTQENNLYEKLKEMPQVASITIKSKMIKVFEQTFAEHLLIFTSFLAGFAIVIAIGIVYNSARIALSERAWELASLRVLGFTRNEVTKLLLGELSLQILLGIPLGFLFGYGLGYLSIRSIPANMIRIPLIIQSSTFAYAALTVFIAAVISSIVIRRQINRLDLVEVLKTLD